MAALPDFQLGVHSSVQPLCTSRDDHFLLGMPVNKLKLFEIKFFPSLSQHFSHLVFCDPKGNVSLKVETVSEIWLLCLTHSSFPWNTYIKG